MNAKRVALAVSLALGALGAWWATESTHRGPRTASQIEPDGRAEGPLSSGRPRLEGGATSAGRVHLAPPLVGHAVTGRVVDDLGVPVPLAQVALRDNRATPMRRERVQEATDELGRFRFSGVEASTYTLELRGGGREALAREVSVIDADVTGIEFVVASGRSLEVLVEADELPTSGLLVSVLGADGVNRSGAPDARGRVVFVVPEGRTRAGLNSFPAGWLPGPGNHSRETRVASEQQTVRLSLVRASVITGFVRRRDGQPIPGAVLWFLPHADALAGSDEEGTFRLAVQVGSVGDIVCDRVMDRSGQPLSRVSYYGIARDVRAGSTGVVVEVDEVARDRVLTVLVRDPDGVPTAGVIVSAWDLGSDDSRFAYTDSSGRATLTKLPARPVDVITQLPGAQQAPWLPARASKIVPNGQEVVLELLRGTWLTGRILGPSGPTLNASIEAWHEDALVAQALSDKEGRFRLTIDPAQHLPLMICARVGKAYRAETLALDRLPTAPLELEVRDR